ncbi:MAG: FAD-dependent oxidoreductase, partial [Vicingaceae bacterium]
MTPSKRVAVIGAGPAGMTAAYQLSKEAGINVEVFEAAPFVGGLAKSIDLWNQRVDIGPHRFFSSDKQVNSLWLEVVGSDYQMVDRLTRILYDDNFFYYPLKPFDALSKLGFIEAARCLWSFAIQRFRKAPDTSTFEGWVTNRFGKRLFEIFFKTYSEKLWGITCDKLDADFAAQRIKKLSLFEVVKNALHLTKKGTHKTLVDQFAYPLGGTGMVYEKMKEKVMANGGYVHLSRPVKKVLTKGNKAVGIELENGDTLEFDEVISSMPLTLLVERLDDVPEQIRNKVSKLTYRNTIMVYLHVDAVDLFPDNWLYIHSQDLSFGRITNFRNWVPQLYGNENRTILALEYWCYEEDDFWTKSDDEIIAQAQEEVRKTSLIGKAAILDGKVIRLPRCYPVYSMGYKEHLKPVEDFLSSYESLSVIGRYGAFKYNNQDHSILMGMRAAENISKGASNDLWDIRS